MIFRRLLTLLGVPLLLALAMPAFARDMTHIMGVTAVPDRPLRIVALTNEAGHVYAVSDTAWATAGGAMAAHLALDDIEKIYETPSTR